MRRNALCTGEGARQMNARHIGHRAELFHCHRPVADEEAHIMLIEKSQVDIGLYSLTFDSVEIGTIDLRGNTQMGQMGEITPRLCVFMFSSYAKNCN